jgi:cytochrome c-type biogenesis protein CcmH/NrfG
MARSPVQLFQNKQSRRPVFILVIVVLALVMFAVGYGLGKLKPEPDSQAMTGGNPNGEMPHPATAEQAPAKAGNLADLLPALEAKVAADPKNVDQRVLLGQTYAELGQRDKAIKELRTAHRTAPQDARIMIVLAAILMNGGSPDELRESYKLLDEAVGRKPEVAPMARLYQGDILMQLGEGKRALKVWKDYLRKMPAGDPQRKLFEDKIAQASAPH